MHNVIPVYKKQGQTPLEAVGAYRKTHPELENVKLGYAGRLDPMAEGLLLLLVGDENKKFSTHLTYDKRYTFSWIFGIETDSYDLLGKITKTHENREIPQSQIEKYLKTLIGTSHQTVPLLSAARHKGKPLFSYINNAEEIVLPQKEITVYECMFITSSTISKAALKDEILTRVANVSGNFRQKDIIAKWNDYFSNTTRLTFEILTAEIFCSSGTYVRSIVSEMGKKVGSGAVTFSIKRTQAGPYKLADSATI